MAKSETKAREENARLRAENRTLKNELEELRIQLGILQAQADGKAIDYQTTEQQIHLRA